MTKTKAVYLTVQHHNRAMHRTTGPIIRGVSATKPNLDYDQIAIKIVLDIDMDLFDPPEVAVSLAVTDPEMVLRPPTAEQVEP